MKILRLLEAEDTATSFDFSVIARECSDFLSHNAPLYRGMRSHTNYVGKFPIREDRRPLHSNYVATASFNIALEYQTKEPLIRTKSMFATPHLVSALSYGSAFYVFPINGTSVIYNPSIEDSITVKPRFGSTDGEKRAFTELAKRKHGDVRVSDLNDIEDGELRNSLIRDIQMEVAGNAYITGYVKQDVKGMSIRPQTRVEYMFYGAPYAYVVSRQAVMDMIKTPKNYMGASLPEEPYTHLLRLIRGEVQ